MSLPYPGAYRQPAILTLPNELLSRIIERTNRDDILRIRQVCRRLFRITKSRQFWINVFHNLRWCMNPLPSLSKPIDSRFSLYSDSELENLVIRSTKGFHQLKLHPVKYRSTSRTLRIFDTPCRDIQYVPGGRWIIVASHTDVHYFDTKSGSDLARILIPRHTIAGACRIIKGAIDVDVGADYCTFNYAIHLRLYTLSAIVASHASDGPHAPADIIQVWRVTSRFNKQGDVVGLSAKRLANIRRESHNIYDSLRCVSLRGRYLASLFVSAEHPIPPGDPATHMDYVSIVDWTSKTEESLYPPVEQKHEEKVIFVNGQTAADLCLISETTVLVSGYPWSVDDDDEKDFIIIIAYDLPSIDAVKGDIGSNFPKQPTPHASATRLTDTYAIDCIWYPYFCLRSDSVRFILPYYPANFAILQGLSVPLSTRISPNNLPTVIAFDGETSQETSPVPFSVVKISGYYRTREFRSTCVPPIVQSERLTQHIWPDTTDIDSVNTGIRAIVNVEQDRLDPGFIGTQFDELSGRLFRSYHDFHGGSAIEIMDTV